MCKVRLHFARTCKVIGLSLYMSACAHDGGKGPETLPKPAPAADVRICADIPPEPQVRGTLVQPVTPEESAGFEEFANGEWAARRWGRLGWTVVGVAQKQFCHP